MDKKNFLRNSLVIKRIPSWINESTRVKVRQINEREVMHPSMVGLSVFRDSINERKQKKIKPKMKSKMRGKHNFPIKNVAYMREKKISKIKLKKQLEDGNAFYDFKSSIDSDPDYIASDVDCSCSDSDGTANHIDTKKKSHKKLNSISKSRSKNDLSSSSEDNEKLIQRSEFKNFQKRKKIVRGKEVHRRFLTLAPVVNKYESKKEMTARHKQMLIDAQKAYDKVVNKIKEEEKIMNLQLATYEKYKSRILENSELLISVSSYNAKQYLCPLYFCSVFSTSPNKHLLEVHKDITTDEDKDIYLKAVQRVRRNFTNGVDESNVKSTQYKLGSFMKS